MSKSSTLYTSPCRTAHILSDHFCTRDSSAEQTLLQKAKLLREVTCTDRKGFLVFTQLGICCDEVSDNTSSVLLIFVVAYYFDLPEKNWRWTYEIR